MIAATTMGIKKYNDLFERRKVLQDIYDGSVKIKETIRCICPPLHEGFLWGGEFFVLASKKIREGMLPQDAVNESAREFTCLSADDKNMISRFAEGLNAGDLKGQISNIELFIKELETALSKAISELNTKGKLYVKGSILTAAAIVLLLI